MQCEYNKANIFCITQYNMKKLLILFFSVMASVAMFAQSVAVSGTVIDADSKEPLIGVSILEVGTTNGIISDLDGNFQINVATGAALQLSYVGYETQEINVGRKTNLGVIELVPEAVGLEDVTITGQIAVQRKTPIAVSQVTALEIEERLGGGEFVEVLKNTPGVHANANGGGWGDSEIWMRGFDNTNIAMMINGVPMNGMRTVKCIGLTGKVWQT